MPTSAPSNHSSFPEDLIGRLNSAITPYEAKLKALRDLENQIIGNRTKKLAFLKLGAAPSVAAILSDAAAAEGIGGDARELHESVLIQSAAAIGSFACGLDAGVKAVLDVGAFSLLLSLISHVNDKALSEAGVIKKLVGLLGGSLFQRDASLESLAAAVRDNQEVASKFVGVDNGKALNVVIELTKDKYPRTRLLACMCLISIRNAVSPYLQDLGIKNNLVIILIHLLDDPGQVGDESPFVLSCLIAEKVDMQKIAFDANAVEKMHEHLKKGSCEVKRLQGILLALADLCSKLECCRDRVLHLKVLDFAIDALTHDSAEVRTAACVFLKNISRSVKNLSAGHL